MLHLFWWYDDDSKVMTEFVASFSGQNCSLNCMMNVSQSVNTGFYVLASSQMTLCAKMLARLLLKNDSTQWIQVCLSSSSQMMEENSKTEVRKAWLCAWSPSKSFSGLGLIHKSNEAGVTGGGSATGGDTRAWVGGLVSRLLSFMRIVFRVAVIVLFSFFKSCASCSCKGPESSYPLGISGLRETLLGLLHLVHNSPVQSVRL